FNISASEFDADGVSPTVQAFLAQVGTFLEVPPTNVKVDYQGSMMHVQKASLKPEAFQGLHLPIAITGGLIEDLYVEVPGGAKEPGKLSFASRSHGRMRIH
ncbi:unnamed protein product, partial [Symbiodinium pilosum]